MIYGNELAMDFKKENTGEPISQSLPVLLVTERLLLRPFRADDLGLIESLYCDADLLKYTPFDAMTHEQAAAHLQQIILDWNRDPLYSLEFAIIRKPTTQGENGEEKIGRCHILIDPDTDTGMIGWFLLREYHGRHYARESGEALIRYCFDVLGLHRVNAVCHPENYASRKALEHCGMRLEACLRQKCRYTKKGVISWEDELEYAVLASEKMTSVCGE